MLIQFCVNLEEQWYPPKDLRKMQIIYKSSFRIAYDEPIMTYDYVYFISDERAKGFNYRELGLFSTADVFELYGNTFRKPLLYIFTPIDFYSVFFTKDHYIYLYKDSGSDTCYNQKKCLSFNNMGECYDSLRIYFDTNSKDAAVYNYNRSHKIKVFNFYDLYRGDFKIIYEVEAKYNVIQSLIYSYGDKKSILIVIDNFGIRFHNLRGSKSFFKDLFKNGRLIKEYDFNWDGKAAFIDDGRKLLYIYNHNFVVFELANFEIINQKNNFIIGEKLECLLGLTDGNALVGTNNGNIYLIGYKNNEITILDKRKICDESVTSLSYNNNCVEKSKGCYTFVANCRYLLIFEIGTGKYTSTDSSSTDSSSTGSSSTHSSSTHPSSTRSSSTYSNSRILNLSYLFIFFNLFLLF